MKREDLVIFEITCEVRVFFNYKDRDIWRYSYLLVIEKLLSLDKRPIRKCALRIDELEKV